MPRDSLTALASRALPTRSPPQSRSALPDPADVRRRALVIAPAMSCGPHGGTRCPCHHCTPCRRPRRVPGATPLFLRSRPCRAHRGGASCPSRSWPAPAPVAASSSCTGWTSQTVPPRTIRVLRTQTGRVRARSLPPLRGGGHGLRRVARAPAPGDAGGRRRRHQAVRLVLRHARAPPRPATRSGNRCYDVRDDTMDQLYRPERANPSIDQQRAIDATWAALAAQVRPLLPDRLPRRREQPVRRRRQRLEALRAQRRGLRPAGLDAPATAAHLPGTQPLVRVVRPARSDPRASRTWSSSAAAGCPTHPSR